MNWEAISAIAEIVGSVAIVVTLVYLAVQIRQSTRASQSAARFESGRYWSNEAMQGALSPDFAQILSVGLENPETLTDTERERLIMWYTEHFLMKDTLYQEYIAGMLPEETWAVHEKILRGLMNYESITKCLDAGFIPLSDGFISFLDRLREESKDSGWSYHAKARIFDRKDD